MILPWIDYAWAIRKQTEQIESCLVWKGDLFESPFFTLYQSPFLTLGTHTVSL